jgi:hypothetical protein
MTNDARGDRAAASERSSEPSSPSLAERILFGFVISMDTQLTWYGQSAFKIVTPGGKILLVDPWLSNPVFENAKDEIAALKDVDLILITHGHSDHVGTPWRSGKRRAQNSSQRSIWPTQW